MISLSTTNTNKEVTLEQVLYIYFPLRFWKNTVDVGALVDSGSEVNVITPTYAAKLGLKVQKTNIGA